MNVKGMTNKQKNEGFRTRLPLPRLFFSRPFYHSTLSHIINRMYFAHIYLHNEYNVLMLYMKTFPLFIIFIFVFVFGLFVI